MELGIVNPSVIPTTMGDQPVQEYYFNEINELLE